MYIFLNPSGVTEHGASRERKFPMNITRACGIVDIASVYETEDREFDPRLAHTFFLPFVRSWDDARGSAS